MRRFDNNGMMLIPEPIASTDTLEGKVLIVTNVYCQHGHSLIDKRAMFNTHPGIVLTVKQGDQTGQMVLSPVVGDKTRVCLGFDLIDGAEVQLCCPHCDIKLPVHSPCDVCNGNLIALFLTPKGNFNDCIAVCNIVACPKANILSSGEVIAISHLEIT
jgi:hypothetical protein